MIFAYVLKDGKKYYFTGSGFDSDPRKKKKYANNASLVKAVHPFYDQINRARYALYQDEVKTPAKKKRTVKKPATKKRATSRRKKNPAPRNQDIKEAIDRFKEFTGHDPKYIDKINLPSHKVGFKIGLCDGILYTAVRDGKTEKYIHRFKSSSRPVLASNHDGEFISLIGGKYKFTERGIIDK